MEFVNENRRTAAWPLAVRALTFPPPPLDPIRYATFRLRIANHQLVHRGDMDVGPGVTTVCGRYVLAGRFQQTGDPITCRSCLRAS